MCSDNWFENDAPAGDGSRVSPESLLRAGSAIEISPIGYSMYPLLVPERDKVVIAPVTERKPRKWDIVLFRRENSILVLHRLVRIRRGQYYFMGDNQNETEGPIGEEQLVGVVTQITRKGKTFRTGNPLYLIYVCLLDLFRPRPSVKRLMAEARRRIDR